MAYAWWNTSVPKRRLAREVDILGMRKGIATFTLDYGRCPRWLFDRMVKLGREMSHVIIAEYGPDEFIHRLGDPVWFQSLGTVLAFDWNASGLTTTLTAALKEAIRGEERQLGIAICGGKGKTSRKTPDQIEMWAGNFRLPQEHTANLVYNSRMSAKVDSSLVQDGFQIYHHAFFFSRSGAWTVVQQGMNTQNQTARRYHWHSAHIKDLVCEPHSGIASQVRKHHMLNLTAQASTKTREVSTELITHGFRSLSRDIALITKYSSKLNTTLRIKSGSNYVTALSLYDEHFTQHPVVEENFFKSRYLQKMLYTLCEIKPKTYRDLVALRGVGPKTVRALALVSEIVYGARPSYEDPARYSFAHGGKDSIPFPVDRETYDKTIGILAHLVSKTHLAASEKNSIYKRLSLKP